MKKNGKAKEEKGEKGDHFIKKEREKKGGNEGRDKRKMGEKGKRKRVKKG